MYHFLMEIEVHTASFGVSYLSNWSIAHSLEWKGEGRLNFCFEVDLNQLMNVTEKNPCCDFALQA